MRTNDRGRRRLRTLVVAAALAAGVASGCEPAPLPPPPPPLTKVACPAGGSITVNTTIAERVQALLAAAKLDKVTLCGSGYRDQARQIELRQAHCGPTYYDIWEKPSSQCTPPTAIPGTSMHEQGLAIDFTNCSTRTTACYTWLAAHAAEFGLRNLPSEPWHWSSNGRSRTADKHEHEHDV